MIFKTLNAIKNSFKAFFKFVNSFIIPFIRFNIILILFVINTLIVSNLVKMKFIPRFITTRIQRFYAKFYLGISKFFDKRRVNSISSISIMELAVSNMKAKKSRTIVTIGGVAIGIGAIVFLVSLGYGLQELVIGRVAKLHEMKQANVSIKAGSKFKITDKILADIKRMPNVADALPLIAVVGKVRYQNSVSSMAVFGVTSDYLTESAIVPIEGQIFDSNEIAANISNTVASKTPVLGASSKRQEDSTYYLNQKISDIMVNISPLVWVPVRDRPNSNSQIIGYTQRPTGDLTGELIAGAYYESSDTANSFTGGDGKDLSKWIRAKVKLWDKESNKYEEAVTSQGNQAMTNGYFELTSDIKVTMLNFALDGSVLGTSIQLAGSASTTPVAVEAPAGQTGEWVSLPDESNTAETNKTETIQLGENAKKLAVVNTAMLKVMGVDIKEAIGKTFAASFVATGDLTDTPDIKVESTPADYTIVGIINDDKSPVFYVPFVDLRSLGITKYSQMKVVTDDKENLAKVRRQVESMGFNTQSVADTVTQITNLFGTIRLILGVMGMVALSVASLGMFNTFTISLMERTREIGLMRAMGMKSDEVMELFLTESMIMGFSGGIAGVTFGFLLGKLLSAALTGFAVIKGGGIIDISYIPPSFITIIMVLSLIVGVCTGIYPAQRAKKISALNALRYE